MAKVVGGAFNAVIVFGQVYDFSFNFELIILCCRTTGKSSLEAIKE